MKVNLISHAEDFTAKLGSKDKNELQMFCHRLFLMSLCDVESWSKSDNLRAYSSGGGDKTFSVCYEWFWGSQWP